MNIQEKEKTVDLVMERLRTTLGRDGWDIARTTNGVHAQHGSVVVTVKEREQKNPRAPWRVRLTDGMVHKVAEERAAADVLALLDPMIHQARQVCSLIDGPTPLLHNPSKSYLGHRLWEAVRRR